MMNIDYVISEIDALTGLLSECISVAVSKQVQ